jgi:hypothetical protein
MQTLMWIGGLYTALTCQATGSPPASQPGSAPSVQWAAPAPNVSPEDAVLLFQTTRRAMRDCLADKPESPPRYRPPALREIVTTLHATARRNGAIVAEARTAPMPLIDAAAAAGAMLGRSARARKSPIGETTTLGMELEWLGERQELNLSLDARGKWTDELFHAFEPGVEGIGVAYRERAGWTRPSQVIASNYSPDLALQAAEQAAGLKLIDKLSAPAEVRYFRFRTRHYWQTADRARPTELTRGEEYVPPERVTREGLDAAISRIGRYLRYRQNSDGWYSEEYLPSVDRYGEGNSARVQIHALQGLTVYATWTGQAEDVNAAKKGLRRSAQFLTVIAAPLTTQPTGHPPATTSAAPPVTGMILAFPGHGDHLEITSRYLAALMALKPEADLEKAADDLVKALTAGQDDQGRLEIVYSEISTDPVRTDSVDDIRGAANALAALAAYGLKRPDDAIMGVFHRAQRYYAGWFRAGPGMAETAVFARALILTYAVSNDARSSDLAFAMLDRIATCQRSSVVDRSTGNTDEVTGRLPELDGAFALRQPGVVGADTATCLLAFADGLALAERIGDRERAERYRRVVLSAARFVLQLEMSEAGAYYVRSRIDAVGGIRASPWNNSLRADHASEALMALIQARRAIFSSPGR